MRDSSIFFKTLAAVPAGRFTTYGTLAHLCGVHVRQVQAWLRVLPSDSGLPWYRIINSKFRITSHCNSTLQYQLLAREGLLPNAKGRFNPDALWPTQS